MPRESQGYYARGGALRSSHRYILRRWDEGLRDVFRKANNCLARAEDNPARSEERD